ncbi:hypothetical protein D3C71_1615850 [compost metagenome]
MPVSTASIRACTASPPCSTIASTTQSACARRYATSMAKPRCSSCMWTATATRKTPSSTPTGAWSTAPPTARSRTSRCSAPTMRCSSTSARACSSTCCWPAWTTASTRNSCSGWMPPARPSTSTRRYRSRRPCVAGNASRTRRRPSWACTCRTRSAGPIACRWCWARVAITPVRRPKASRARPTMPPPTVPA